MTKKELDQIYKTLGNRKGTLDNQLQGYRRAGILIPLIEKDDGIHILFEVRSKRLSWQPGEISFPGGAVEPTDATFYEAATRETCEELGLESKDIKKIGEMDSFSSYLGLEIYPMVGLILNPEKIKAPQDEVEEVFTVPLKWFLENDPLEASVEVGTRPMPNFPLDLFPEGFNMDWRIRTEYPVLFYSYEKWLIWGLTANVLKNFLDHYEAKR